MRSARSTASPASASARSSRRRWRSCATSPAPRSCATSWTNGTIWRVMTDRHAKALARLEELLRSGPGELAPAVRTAAIDAGPLPDPLAQRYAETLRQHAYKLTDQDLE